MHRMFFAFAVVLGVSAGVHGDAVKDAGGPLPSQADMEKLARTNPVAFLENCLRKHAREVKGYTLKLHKQENIGGRINPAEVIDVSFRDQPHSVLFIWQDGARLAERVLYVAGENGGMMLARPKGAVARLVAGDVAKREVNGDDAKQSGRYTLAQFGFRKAEERTLQAWRKAQEEQTLNVEYLGLKKVPEVGDRTCFVMRRINKTPDPDGVKETTFYVDAENWLQTGAVSKDETGLLVGSYFFRDVKLNPTFGKDQFTPAALKP